MNLQELVATVAQSMMQRSWTLAVAESCTGGMLGASLTMQPGASRWFLGGTIVYSNSLKARLLDLDRSRLESEGAVSEWTACAMAVAVRSRTGADLGVSITGVAGPSGGSPEKPVGSVWFALDAPHGTYTRLCRFGGDREAIRERSVLEALDGIGRYPASSAATLPSWNQPGLQ